MSNKVIWFVNSGVDYSHRLMNVKAFNKLCEAKDYYLYLDSNEYSNQFKELVRMDDNDKKVVTNTDIDNAYLQAQKAYLYKCTHKKSE